MFILFVSCLYFQDSRKFVRDVLCISWWKHRKYETCLLLSPFFGASTTIVSLLRGRKIHRRSTSTPSINKLLCLVTKCLIRALIIYHICIMSWHITRALPLSSTAVRAWPAPAFDCELISHQKYTSFHFVTCMPCCKAPLPLLSRLSFVIWITVVAHSTLPPLFFLARPSLERCCVIRDWGLRQSTKA